MQNVVNQTIVMGGGIFIRFMWSEIGLVYQEGGPGKYFLKSSEKRQFGVEVSMVKCAYVNVTALNTVIT